MFQVAHWSRGGFVISFTRVAHFQTSPKRYHDKMIPFIIVGHPRSGSTLLREAMAQHSEIKVLGELFHKLENEPAIPAPAGKWLRARGDSLSFRKLHYQISGLSGPVRNFFSPVFTFRWPSPHGLRMLSLREQETVTTTTESSPAGPQTDQGAQTPERGCTPRSRSQVLRASG